MTAADVFRAIRAAFGFRRNVPNVPRPTQEMRSAHTGAASKTNPDNGADKNRTARRRVSMTCH